MDVGRLRRVAVKRMGNERVGMVMTCRQVLALIARGDARVAAYEARIAELEEEVRMLEALVGEYPEGTVGDVPDDGLVPIGELMEEAGLSRTQLTRLASRGCVRAEKRPGVTASGAQREIWHVDRGEVLLWRSLSVLQQKRVAQGELSLANCIEGGVR